MFASGADLCIEFAYMSTLGNIKLLCIDKFNLLDEDILHVSVKRRLGPWVDFNARMGKN